MKREYDFSKGKRGAVIKPRPGKTRITIRIDDDVLEWFRAQAHAAGGGSTFFGSLIQRVPTRMLAQLIHRYTGVSVECIEQLIATR